MVRKSVQEAEAGTEEVEARVEILAGENDWLQMKVELLQDELSVHWLLSLNASVLPEHVHREQSKRLDNLNQQHNAQARM